MPVLARQQDVITFKDLQPDHADYRSEILEGLQRPQKYIDPKYFYDSRGSELFEKITKVPEYYPTRTERAILKNHATEIAQCSGTGCILIEPGAGSSEKVRLLLESLKPTAYVPIDIAGDFLYESASKLAEEYPWLKVQAYCDDFANYDCEQYQLPPGKRLVFYPGSTIGNMLPEQAQDFLKKMALWLEDDGGLLIGVDLHKSENILNAAYNDRQGVTADFNLNVLDNINALTDADFDTANFEHRAFYNKDQYRIEMHLQSKISHTVKIEDATINFDKGETIHTENSYKYTLDKFNELINAAGLRLRKSWRDADQLFSVHYIETAG